MSKWELNEELKAVTDKLNALATIISAFADTESGGLNVGCTALNYVSGEVSGCQNDLQKLIQSDNT